jgi:hypothetical protein
VIWALVWLALGVVSGFIFGRVIAYRDEQVPTGRPDTDR